MKRRVTPDVRFLPDLRENSTQSREGGLLAQRGCLSWPKGMMRNPEAFAGRGGAPQECRTNDAALEVAGDQSLCGRGQHDLPDLKQSKGNYPGHDLNPQTERARAAPQLWKLDGQSDTSP